MSKQEAKKSTAKSTKKVNNNSTSKKNNIKKEVKEKVVNKKIENKKVDEVKEVKVSEKVTKTKESKKDKLKKGIEKIDKNRNVVYALVGGILFGVFVNMLFWPDRIAKLENGAEPVASIDGKTVTADELYENMKEFYSVNYLLDTIDDYILSEMYPEDDEMKDEVEETADYYISMYENYGYTEESFLSNNGFKNKDEFIDYLKLDYRRKLYYDEYVKDTITDKEIENYYNDEVFGDIDSKHILVEISDDMDDDAAKALANEIITKLNNGATFDEVKEEYKDSITYEELGYQAFDASLEESYMNALKDLNNGEYTKEPVKTSYGYHVIYRIDQKEKAKLDDIKDAIIDVIADNKKEDDENLYYKALINLREEKNIEFSDTVMGDKYKEYISQYK